MTPVLQLEDIHYAYAADRPVLRGVNLALSSKARLAIRGPIGAGKTTLFLIAMGLLKPSQGRVVVFGRERQRERDFLEVRRRLGLLFQDSDDQLFCPTVREDVMFGPLNLDKSPAEAARIAECCLEQVGLSGFMDRLTWSPPGGEKRLVALASVLAMEPEALLLDEPTNNLDEASRTRVIEVLQHLSKAMLLITHDDEVVAQLSAETWQLQDGTLQRG